MLFLGYFQCNIYEKILHFCSKSFQKFSTPLYISVKMSQSPSSCATGAVGYHSKEQRAKAINEPLNTVVLSVLG